MVVSAQRVSRRQQVTKQRRLSSKSVIILSHKAMIDGLTILNSGLR